MTEPPPEPQPTAQPEPRQTAQPEPHQPTAQPEVPRKSFRGTVASVNAMMNVLHHTPSKMMQHILDAFPDGLSYVRVDPSLRILVRFDKYVRPGTVRKALPLYKISSADFEEFGVKPPTGSVVWGTIPRIGRPPARAT